MSPATPPVLGTVLYCTVLYCTVLYYTVLYCTVLYCTVLYCTGGNYAPVREMALSSVLLETVRTHVGGGALDIGLPDLLAILRQMRRIAEGVQKPVFKQHLDLDMKRIGPLFNSSGLRRGETPSGNGNCSARGLARVAAAMANRRQLS